jgi:hypothetical protein
LALAGAALGGCSPPAAPHDKAYYARHAADRSAELAACRNDPGRLARRANCINAQAADADAEARRFWAMPKPVSRLARPGVL